MSSPVEEKVLLKNDQICICNRPMEIHNTKPYMSAIPLNTSNVKLFHGIKTYQESDNQQPVYLMQLFQFHHHVLRSSLQQVAVTLTVHLSVEQEIMNVSMCIKAKKNNSINYLIAPQPHADQSRNQLDLHTLSEYGCSQSANPPECTGKILLLNMRAKFVWLARAFFPALSQCYAPTAVFKIVCSIY